MRKLCDALTLSVTLGPFGTACWHGPDPQIAPASRLALHCQNVLHILSVSRQDMCPDASCALTASFGTPPARQ